MDPPAAYYGEVRIFPEKTLLIKRFINSSILVHFYRPTSFINLDIEIYNGNKSRKCPVRLANRNDIPCEGNTHLYHFYR